MNPSEGAQIADFTKPKYKTMANTKIETKAEDFKRLLLKSERFAMKIHYSKQILNTLNIFTDEYSEAYVDQVILFLQMNLLTDKIIQKTEVKVPKNWFQHFKQQYLPKALIRIFPIKVKCIEVEFTRRYIYPFIDVPNSNHYIHDEIIIN